MSGCYCSECDEWVDVDTCEMSPGEVYEEECESCGKSFGVEIEYDVVVNAHSAPCMGGEPHNWRDYLLDGFDAEYMRCYFEVDRECRWCGLRERVSHPQELREKLLAEWREDIRHEK